MSAAVHVLTNTYRRDRHGPLPVPALVGATALQPSVPPPVPRELVAELRAPGRRFVIALWNSYDEWNPIALVLLRQAAEVVDALAQYRARLKADGFARKGPRGKVYPHALLRVQSQARTMLRGLLAHLNLEK